MFQWINLMKDFNYSFLRSFFRIKFSKTLPQLHLLQRNNQNSQNRILRIYNYQTLDRIVWLKSVSSMILQHYSQGLIWSNLLDNCSVVLSSVYLLNQRLLYVLTFGNRFNGNLIKLPPFLLLKLIIFQDPLNQSR